MKQKHRDKLNLSKTMLTILCLSIIQIGAAIGVVLYDYIDKRGTNGNSLLLIIIIIMAVFVNSYITVKDVKFKEWYETPRAKAGNPILRNRKVQKTCQFCSTVFTSTPSNPVKCCSFLCGHKLSWRNRKIKHLSAGKLSKEKNLHLMNYKYS